jgi:hypothetical protein
MTAPALKLKPLMRCQRCNAEIAAGCDCGADYSPVKRAAEAVAANPDRSDRSIAEDIDVSPTTVGKARKNQLSSGGHLKRTGRDGRTRRAPMRKPKQDHAEEKIELVTLMAPLARFKRSNEPDAIRAMFHKIPGPQRDDFYRDLDDADSMVAFVQKLRRGSFS